MRRSRAGQVSAGLCHKAWPCPKSGVTSLMEPEATESKALADSTASSSCMESSCKKPSARTPRVSGFGGRSYADPRGWLDTFMFNSVNSVTAAALRWIAQPQYAKIEYNSSRAKRISIIAAVTT